jgi:hypothetical protein
MSELRNNAFLLRPSICTTAFLAWNDVNEGWQTGQDCYRLAALAGAEACSRPRSLRGRRIDAIF